MDTLALIAMFFDRGAKAMNEVLNREMGEGRLIPGSFTGRDKLNLLMLRLLALRAAQALSESDLSQAVELFESEEISDGTRVVYAMLVFDMARELGISLRMTEKVGASGEQIDWDLLALLKHATPAFHKRAQLMLNARKVQKASE